MAKAFKCDRCGAYYDGSGVGVSCVAIGGQQDIRTGVCTPIKRIFDVCPTCAKKIEWFMNLEKPEEAEEKKE